MESTAENYRGRNEKKQSCYTMVVSNAKDVPEEIRSVATGIEEGVNMIKSESGAMQVKAQYKRFTFDFFKPEGCQSEGISLSLPKGAKKGKTASKVVIAAYLVALGDQMKIQYTIEEDLHTYKFNVILNSGDAFAVNSQVQGLTYTVT